MTEIEISTADVPLLLGRIDALQQLLVVYRTGGRPTEALFTRLDRTKKTEDRIRAALTAGAAS